jgi:hypothetical protein
MQGLWIGTELSALERLSIASFLEHGHEYHLYVYGDVRNVPEGTTIKDGGEILPASLIFQYREHKSFSAFANFFRYKLLLENGGWWVDADTICLRPFDVDRDTSSRLKPSAPGSRELRRRQGPAGERGDVACVARLLHEAREQLKWARSGRG